MQEIPARGLVSGMRKNTEKRDFGTHGPGLLSLNDTEHPSDSIAHAPF